MKGALDRIRKNKFLNNYFTIYTILFVIGALAAFYVFIVSDKSFVWEEDGTNQHYPYLQYYLNYFKDFVRSLLSGNPSLPQWSNTVGLGADPFMMLSTVGFFDPINYIALLFPNKMLPYTFDFLVILRLYLAGLAFSAFCYHFQKPRSSILIGAIAYAFSGYVLFAAIRHPFFITPLIYFPFILLGFEWILQKRKPYLFITSLALSAIINLYFFFMMTIFLLIYACIRYFMITQKKERKLSGFSKLFFRSAGYYSIAVLLSAFAIVLFVNAFFSSTRSGGDYGASLLLYDINYYLKFFASFVSFNIDNVGDWTITSFLPLTVIAVILLFTQKHPQNKYLRIMFLICTGLLLFPIFGYLLNGGGNISNRWCFVYAFLGCFILVDRLPYMKQLVKKDYIAISSVFSAFLLSAFCFPILFKTLYMGGILLFGITFIVIIAVNRLSFGKDRKKWLSSKAYPIFAAVTIGSLFFQALFFYDIPYKNYVSSYMSHEDGPYHNYNNTSHNKLINQVKNEETFSRIEIDNMFLKNDALVHNFNGTSMYYSMYQNNIAEYFKNLQMDSRTSSWVIRNLDMRTSPLALWNVKYLIKNQKSSPLPYGFEKVDSYKNSELYKNQYALPMGYTYSKYLTYEELKQLPAIQQQELMLQAAIIHQDLPAIPKASSDAKNTTDLPYEIELGSGIKELGSNVYQIRKAGAAITLRFQTPPDSENYLEIDGSAFHFYPPKDYMDLFYANPTEHQKREFYYTKSINRTTPTTLKLDLTTDTGIKRTGIILSNVRSNYYKKQGTTFNLGYAKQSIQEVTLTFDQIGEFSFDKINIHSVSMEQFQQSIADLSENTLQNAIVKDNIISGNITIAKPKLLFLSVPYSAGWKATVNGKPQEILETNYMGMGLLLEPENGAPLEIRLEYHTPYFNLGIWISLTTLAIYILEEVTVTQIKKHKKLLAEQSAGRQ